MDLRIREALETFDFVGEPTGIPQHLPLLDDYRRNHRSTDLSGHGLLVIQHQLGTTVPLVKALIEDGIDASRTWFVDIPYSTHPEVRDALLHLAGNPDRCPALFTDPLVDYNPAQLTRVISTLFDMLEQGDNRDLIVLDDGAYFLRALSVLNAISHDAAHEFRGVRMIEQTTRGHEFLKSHADELPPLGVRALSVARTTTKLQVEAPFIGVSVGAALASKVASLRPDGIDRVAILGYGVIGKACTRHLSREFTHANMTIVDDDERRRRPVRADHPNVTFERTLTATESRQVTASPGYDLVVGCTGRNSFTLQDRHLLAHNAILASGSSAAVEFDRAGFVELADYRADDEIEVLGRAETHARGIHADITVRLEGGVEATFVNAGFPVNFDGRRECLPLGAIQPTRCLMYAAVHEVQAQGTVHLAGLGQEADEWIYAEGLKHLTD